MIARSNAGRISAVALLCMAALVVVLTLMGGGGPRAAMAQSGGYSFDRVKRAGDYMRGDLRMSNAAVSFTTGTTDLTFNVGIERSGTSGLTSTLVVTAPNGMWINRRYRSSGNMLMLQDFIETGGADINGRLYAYSNGTEADSDVMLGFWDSDEQAYRTFGWDEGSNVFSLSTSLVLLSGGVSATGGNVAGNSLVSNTTLQLDNAGGGSESQIILSGTLGAGNSNTALTLRACSPTGTLASPYNSMQLMGPYFSGSSVECMRWTTTANYSLVQLNVNQINDVTGHGGITLDGSGNATFHSVATVTGYIDCYRFLDLDLGGTGSESQINLAGTLGPGSSNTALVIRACDPADGTNTTPWTGLTFLGPNVTGSSVEMCRMTTTNVLLPFDLTLTDDLVTVTDGATDIGQSGTEVGTLWVQTIDDGDGTVNVEANLSVSSLLFGQNAAYLDYLGTGSEAVAYFSGLVGAAASSSAMSIKACKSDGTLGAPYVGLSLWGPHFTGSSVPAMYVTTTVVSVPNKFVTPLKSKITIDSDAMTITGSYHELEGQGDVSDDLATINGGVDGARLTVRAFHTDHTITINETGNIVVPGASIALDSTDDQASFVFDNILSKWFCTSFSDNG